MNHRNRKNRHPPWRKDKLDLFIRDTLSSQQVPVFTSGKKPEPNSSSNTFRVPSPSTSDEEDEGAIATNDRAFRLPIYPYADTSSSSVDRDSSPIRDNSHSLSNLGDSSSLFSTATPGKSETFGATTEHQRVFQFTGHGDSVANPFVVNSSSPSIMVVEREPPKASPHKHVQQPSIISTQPEFGKPSPLRNRLQPQNPLIAPKPHQPRPEHHRTAPAPVFMHPKSSAGDDPIRTSQYSQPVSGHGYPNPTVISVPTTQTLSNTYPRPQIPYSSLHPPGGFTSVNSYQRPIDLTKPQAPAYYADPALQSDRFGAEDPYLYIDAGKATENIKALLEGALDDEDDKPRTRGRKKKQETDVQEVADKLSSLGVHSGRDSEKDEQDDDQEEDVDDGTVEGLEVKLLPHQIDGVEWMRDKENSMKKKNGILPKGGILADDMGLGKTIQSIALILTHPRPVVSSSASVTNSRTLPSSVGKNTLVVAPLALIKQWEAEIKSRVSETHSLRVYVHHGPQRTKSYEFLRKYDVVITTYQILVSEHGSSRDDGPQVGCFGLHWYRVILDEAHTIKNRNAKATKACCALRSEYRWCLTGTPMQNNLDELQSLINFLKIKPYNDLTIWKDQITRPMSQGRGGVAIKRLQFYLKAFMKRRTKDVLKKEGALNPGGKASSDKSSSNGFKITARSIENVVAEFDPNERHFYDRLEQRTDKSLEQMMGGQKMNYASALVLLLRLRQACNHPQLVGGSMANDKDALTTGQAGGSSSPQKSKVKDDDVDEMADLLGGLSVKTKQCDVCQIELTRDAVSAGMIRCFECEEDLASQTTKNKIKSTKHEKPRKSSKVKVEKKQSRVDRKSRIIESSDEEDDGEWIVPQGARHSEDHGVAGGTDDENAEGGGESLASYDTDTADDSEVKVEKPRPKQVISLDISDEEESCSSDKEGNLSQEESELSDSLPSGSSPVTSAKIRHLITILTRESPKHKVIVFSQFTSMLDLIEPFLREEDLTFTRYDGSMRNDLREASLERLRNHSKTRILLCSLKCGSLGLNLTAASRVVILEPFWNPFVEEQAIDRVHRLNQTQDVVVYKLTVKDTVEARILDLQEKKRALANAAIEGKAVGKLSMKDILNLFRRDAEHDASHDVHAGLGDKTRVLAPAGATGGALSGRDMESSSRKVTPPAMGKPNVKEDAVYGRRW